ncbi:hypothetical protein ACIA5G_45675 [Amycolatopsis sp. NPDC051758]|uniref:hypothetical protein n=1 Tax=Amycolatopsis sp. NPDC051758 TaxID=3363935 RepID=UPI00379553EA
MAKVIVAAATDRNPKLRRTAGSTAASIGALRAVLPARLFDRIVRRFNRMPNWRPPADVAPSRGARSANVRPDDLELILAFD